MSCVRLFPEFLDRILDFRVFESTQYEERVKECGEYPYLTQFLPSPISYETEVVGEKTVCEGQFPEFLDRILDACPSCSSTYEERQVDKSPLRCATRPVAIRVPVYLNDNEKHRVEIFEKAMRKDKF